MSGFKFVDEVPPITPGARGARVYREFAEALRERPGDWAELIVDENTTVQSKRNLASNIRNGRYAALRPGFEAISRKVDGVVKVYVRYVGDDE